MNYDLARLGAQFEILGDFISAERHGSGHINDTFAATYESDGRPVRYVHQRINHEVFKDPPALMDNVARVTAHIRDKLRAAGADQIERRVLTLVPARRSARCGDPTYHRDADGNYWRTYLFVENATTYDVVPSVDHAFEAARAIGNFQRQLADLPGPRLAETIPDFRNTPKRFAALQLAIARDVCNRAASCATEIALVERNETMLATLLDLQAKGEIPERVTHNDTKLNNVMFDDETSEGICVVDLDTVMPGLAPWDFGDMVRTGTAAAKEDEQDLSKVILQMPMFEALARGYLESAGAFLNRREQEHLVFAGGLMTLEIAMRFLTDYLSGDTYFRIHREDHNLDRCRRQLKMFEEIQAHADEMNMIVERTAESVSD